MYTHCNITILNFQEDHKYLTNLSTNDTNTIYKEVSYDDSSWEISAAPFAGKTPYTGYIIPDDATDIAGTLLPGSKKTWTRKIFQGDETNMFLISLGLQYGASVNAYINGIALNGGINIGLYDRKAWFDITNLIVSGDNLLAMYAMPGGGFGDNAYIDAKIIKVASLCSDNIHKYWRIFIYNSNNTQFTQYITMGEMQLLSDNIINPNMAGWGIATATSYYTDYYPSKAFELAERLNVCDGCSQSVASWYSNSYQVTNQHLTYEFTRPVAVKTIICNGGGQVESHRNGYPKDFDFQYSDNGTDWTTVLEVRGEKWELNEYVSYELEQTYTDCSIICVPSEMAVENWVC